MTPLIEESSARGNIPGYLSAVRTLYISVRYLLNCRECRPIQPKISGIYFTFFWHQVSPWIILVTRPISSIQNLLQWRPNRLLLQLLESPACSLSVNIYIREHPHSFMHQFSTLTLWVKENVDPCISFKLYPSHLIAMLFSLWHFHPARKILTVYPIS